MLKDCVGNEIKNGSVVTYPCGCGAMLEMQVGIVAAIPSDEKSVWVEVFHSKYRSMRLQKIRRYDRMTVTPLSYDEASERFERGELGGKVIY